MSAALQEVLDQDASDQTLQLGAVDAGQEDAFWERAYWRERYYSPGLDYEDYAPAYCVGYIGYAQYGGSYDEAEKSLCANWERIKGDSRLSLADAREAMRAAWERMAERPEREAAKKSINVGLLRHRLRMPSFRLNASALR
jgi:hypothetical protein